MVLNEKNVLDARLNAINLLMKHFKNNHFEGELSESALATALAVFTLGLFDYEKYISNIHKGIEWLIKNQNKDGGWGDTSISMSNISTTLICWAVLIYYGNKIKQASFSIKNAEKWIKSKIGEINQKNIIKSLLSIYGKDKTFSVPIMTMLALAVGDKYKIEWSLIPQLPFELAVFPHKLYRYLKLNVVSYAVPALIAIGLVRHKKKPTKIILMRIIRNMIENKVLRKLEKLQPDTGGFLEAVPLTAFVLMSLKGSGIIKNPVVEKGLNFLNKSIRNNGGYPIDTDLKTWVTTLSINALNASGRIGEYLDESDRINILNWLLKQQNTSIHPFTNADPGGWGWTDLSGAVPDGDDTSGALISLYNLGKYDQSVLESVKKGIMWLISIQNDDGGIPAFCKGWGKLPFDASCPDITAHFIRAFVKWIDFFKNDIKIIINDSIKKAVKFLKKYQYDEGYWIPLWFGNEHAINKVNPVYGTSQVLISLRECSELYYVNDLIVKGCKWLSNNQNDDGGWGGKKRTVSTIEETSLAVNALSINKENFRNNINKGLNWLVKNTNNFTSIPPSPIGLYFASLWYYERLYPVVFTVSALERLFLKIL